jgi:hypothetical protein
MAERRRADNTMAERSRADSSMAERKRIKRQTMIYKTRHRKLTIEQHEHQYKRNVNSGAPEG